MQARQARQLIPYHFTMVKTPYYKMLSHKALRNCMVFDSNRQKPTCLSATFCPFCEFSVLRLSAQNYIKKLSFLPNFGKSAKNSLQVNNNRLSLYLQTGQQPKK